MDDPNEEAGTGGERTAPDDVTEEGLHDGRFKGGDGLFANGCGRRVSEGGENEEPSLRTECKKELLKGARVLCCFKTSVGVLRKRVEKKWC